VLSCQSHEGLTGVGRQGMALESGLARSLRVMLYYSTLDIIMMPSKSPSNRRGSLNVKGLDDVVRDTESKGN
jgi:hypothetical protein